MRLITITNDFFGATDERGITASQYSKGSFVVVQPGLAETFVNGQLARNPTKDEHEAFLEENPEYLEDHPFEYTLHEESGTQNRTPANNAGSTIKSQATQPGKAKVPRY